MPAILQDRFVPLSANDRQQPEQGGGNFIDYFDRERGRPLGNNFGNFRRPFLDKHGHPCVLVNTGDHTVDGGQRKPIKRKRRIFDLLNEGERGMPLWVFNATTLRPEDWQEVDRRVVMSAREPLIAWEDLVSRSSYSGFNAYARMTLEYEAMSDAHEAVVDFDLMTGGRNDNPLMVRRSIPLPITHSDFWYSDRRLEISSNNGDPLSTYSAEMAARRVGEMVEDTLLGNVTGPTYGTVSAGPGAIQGTSTAYGYRNFTYRSIKTNLTTPTGANPQATVSDVLDMIQTLKADKYHGPYMLYYSLAWGEFMGNDYAWTNGAGWAVAPTKTLLQRLKELPELIDIKELPRLSTPDSFILIMVDMKASTIEAVDGQPITTLQWESMGGLRKNFKVWCIQVPYIKAEYNQNSGILVATTS